MTDMFIPRKERVRIIIEAVIYVAFVILASYFTIHGDIFIKMVPMLYFLGILGCIMFKKPIITVLLGIISIVTFGIIGSGGINKEIILLAVYATFMIAIGEVAGYLSNLLYENFKLRKFIKYYNKILYIFLLIICILVPLFLNNLVNSNYVSYMIAKNRVEKYINENYPYTSIYTKDTKYIPSYSGGIYEFDVVIDDVEVKLTCNSSFDISDINMDARKDNLNKIANAETKVILTKNNITGLDITCRYDYSKIATIPDVIKISIDSINNNQISDLIKYIDALKSWDKFDIVDRIDVLIDNVNVTINKKDLREKKITESYILNGAKQELLDSKEGR